MTKTVQNRNLWARPRWGAARNEKGSTSITVAVALLGLFGLFGLVVDGSRYVYVRNVTQVAADLAVTQAVNMTVTDRNGVTRVRYEGWERAVSDYAVHTRSLRKPDTRGMLTCPGNVIPWRAYSDEPDTCWPAGDNRTDYQAWSTDPINAPFPTNNRNTNPGDWGWGQLVVLDPSTGPTTTTFNFCSTTTSATYRVKYVINESMNTTFLQMFGFKEIPFTVEATAAVRNESC